LVGVNEGSRGQGSEDSRGKKKGKKRPGMSG